MVKSVAGELAKQQKLVSVSEFFTKNRHLLGFDNPIRALQMAVKEAVDNSLDAINEMRIPPELIVELNQISEKRFKIIVEDNGPGIVKQQIPNVFGKLLYGSKFHRYRQSLTHDQPIIIKDNNKVQILPIGKFIDAYLKFPGEYTLKGKTQVPCFNPKTFTYDWKNVTNLIKHKRDNEIIRINTEYNKEIKVTGCHSLFTVKDGKVIETEARNIETGDYIVAPKKIPSIDSIEVINMLEYIKLDSIKNNRFYIYGIKPTVKSLLQSAIIVHKKTSKSRKFYRIKKNNEVVDILDDGANQYLKKGFLPLKYIIKLKIFNQVKEGIIRTYRHGEPYDFPLTLQITSQFMRFLGLYTARGHTTKRSVELTFGKHEQPLIDEIVSLAQIMGAKATISPRRNSIRIRVYHHLLVKFINAVCRKRAKNKEIPEFIFRVNSELRQHFLDAYFQRHGHKVKRRDSLMVTTISKKLAHSLRYLLKFQGITPSFRKCKTQGLGKTPSWMYILTIYGNQINKFNVFHTSSETRSTGIDSLPLHAFNVTKNQIRSTPTRCIEHLGLGFSERIREKYLDIFNNLRYSKKYTEPYIKTCSTGGITQTHLSYLQEKGYLLRKKNHYTATTKFQELKNNLENLNKFSNGDLCLLKVTDKLVVNTEDKYVYDLSVENFENFVGGFGGISCHNSRGSQGIGISASVLYSQLTTGKATKITSKTGKKDKAHYYELNIDTKTNEPQISKEEVIKWDKDHGTRVELELEGRYQKGKQSVDEFIKQVAIVNPEAHITYNAPSKEKVEYPRATKDLPAEAKEIKPHPHGIELGMLIQMMHDTKSRTVQGFLTTDFSRIGSGTAKKMCDMAEVTCNARPSRIAKQEVEKLFNAMQQAKVIAPPTNCLSPITEDVLEKGLRKEVDADFYSTVTRPPSVYRGFPFNIEIGIAYGGNLDAEGSVRLMRFANRVPLLYQQGACAITKAIGEINWRPYGLQQSGNNLPRGPAILLVHMASVWVPFTSEAKDAIAHYPEIIKEIKLASQEAGRKLSSHIRKTVRVKEQKERVGLFEKYIPEVASSLAKLTKEKKRIIEIKLEKILKKSLRDLIPQEEIKENKHGKKEKQTTLGTGKSRR